MNPTNLHSKKFSLSGKSPSIMGILNVTDDSFSDGGLYNNPCDALRHAEEMLEQGADIIDVGAESTRPNAAKVSETDELRRLIPIISELSKNFPDIPISVDTYKPSVARAAVESGAGILNDVYSKIENGEYKMAQLAAELNVPLIVTHNLRDEALGSRGERFFSLFLDDMKNLADVCLESGIDSGDIILDPGFGFGKTRSENFELVRRLGELKGLGYPVLLGVSRKSALVDTVGGDIEMRDIATSAISAYVTLQNSADIIRVHDVRKNVAAVKTALMLI